MPLRPAENDLNNRRSSLASFYSAALASAVVIGLTSRFPALRIVLLVVGAFVAVAAVLFLKHFLRSRDELERQINYRALVFAFCGTLLFSLLIGLLQAAGFHPISWLGIPVLMLILWSIGLIVYSWRYR